MTNGLNVRAVLLAGMLLPAALHGQTQAPSQSTAAPTPRLPATLRSDQRESLVTLGRVWGFVKYHHPRFVQAGANVDSALFDVLPRVLAAKIAPAALDSMSAWLDAMGTPTPCTTGCVKVPVAAGPGVPANGIPALTPVTAALLPSLEWIHDPAVVSPKLSTRLVAIHSARPAVAKQHYVGPASGVRNPQFTNEPQYSETRLSEPALRLLGVYRLWNILEYWFPYRDLMEPDRVAMLRDAVAGGWSAAAIPDRRNPLDDYQRVMLRLITRVSDTHANIWSALSARPPGGPLLVPVGLRMIEGKPVVSAVERLAGDTSPSLEVGDAVLAVNGVSVESLFRAWTPYYAASNEPTRQRDMASWLLRGAEQSVSVTINRAGRRLTLTVQRGAATPSAQMLSLTHDLPGETFQLLSPEVAYVKLGTLRKDSVNVYLDRARDAKVLVIDNRNYPGDFPIYTLGGRLVPKATPFSMFTRADWSNPGAFLWDGGTTTLRPITPTFAGKVVVLVDEVTQSSSEFHAMAFRTAPGAIVVGSTTAGADGNVSEIPLPGGMRAMITGIGIFYPDRRPTQQIGIVPDLVARPTLAGFRAGRDEVLEAGVSRALGRPFRLTRPQ
jgi:C-terminal processing protease CtpA/Prc